MAAPQTELIVLKASEEIGRYALEPGVYTIGCSSSCSIQIDVPGISRQHAQLSVAEDGRLSLQDLGSSHGSMVDEQPVSNGSAVSVLPNQTISLGSAVSLLVQQQSAPGEGSDVSLAEEDQSGLPPEFRTPERYSVGEQIAKGGMGAILNARQSTIRREVAMKIILGAAEESPRHRLRFIEEAQITGQLEHPNIVPVHDAGIDAEGRIFYTMKLVKGITLKKILELIKKGAPGTLQKYPLASLLTIFQKVCDAVAFAHSKGVIHRDLKPENIMIGSYGEVLVMDWGLAKLIGRTSGTEVSFEVASARFDEGESHATMDGCVMGTPSYMAPEQARGEVEKLDQRTDIFSLGVILYEMLTLERPFTGRNGREIMERLVSGDPPFDPAKLVSGSLGKGKRPKHLPNTQVPKSLSAVVMKGLSHDPAGRYQRVDTLQSDLSAYQNGFATSAESAGLLKQLTLLIKRHKVVCSATALVLVVALGFGGNALFEGRRASREAVRANRALSELRDTAPALLALAVSEANSRRYDDALGQVNAALALNPGLTDGYWRRSWLLLAKREIPRSIASLEEAIAHDPHCEERRKLLPLLQRMRIAPEPDRYSFSLIKPVYDHLGRVGADGEAMSLVGYLTLGNQERLELVSRKIEQWLGPLQKYPLTPLVESTSAGIHVNLSKLHLANLEPLHSLPIEKLEIQECGVEDLKPLNGLLLKQLSVSGRISSVEALRGMPLKFLCITSGVLTDLSPLKGSPLEELQIYSAPISDFSMLQGMPLHRLLISGTHFNDARVLSGLSLIDLNLAHSPLSDITPLEGLPLKSLSLWDCPEVSNLKPLLKIASLETFETSASLENVRVLRSHPGLKQIRFKDRALQSVLEFWKEYDAKQSTEKK